MLPGVGREDENGVFDKDAEIGRNIWGSQHGCGNFGVGGIGCCTVEEGLAVDALDCDTVEDGCGERFFEDSRRGIPDSHVGF